MKHLLACLSLACATLPSWAVQETFTDTGAMDCSSVTPVAHCTQLTSDQLFALRFKPVYPWSGPSPQGFEVRQQVIDLRNASGGLLDLGIMSVSITGSTAYNGTHFTGGIRLDVKDGVSGEWRTVGQWSSWVDSPLGIYVAFNGLSPQAPLVRDVRAIRLIGVNGTTSFRIGMMNLNPS